MMRRMLEVEILVSVPASATTVVCCWTWTTPARMATSVRATSIVRGSKRSTPQTEVHDICPAEQSNTSCSIGCMFETGDLSPRHGVPTSTTPKQSRPWKDRNVQVRFWKVSGEVGSSAIASTMAVRQCGNAVVADRIRGYKTSGVFHSDHHTHFIHQFTSKYSLVHSGTLS